MRPVWRPREPAVLLFVAMVPLGAGLGAVAAGLSGDEARALALIVGTIGLLATQIVPELVAALLFFAAASLIGAAPPQVIFSGFAASALWLVAGGLLLAASMRRTGLGDRLAASLALRLSSSYPRLVMGVLLLGTLLAFLVPAAMGRIVILVPLLLILTARLDLEPTRPAYFGVMLAAILGTTTPGFAILPSNLPNLVLAGAAESALGIELSYLDYLAANFPVLGILKLPILWALTLLLFPDRLEPAQAGEGAFAREPRAPLSAAEWRLLALSAAVILFWASDRLHGLSAGGIALAAGAICLLPRIGFLDPAKIGEDLGVAALFYVAAILGLVAVAADSGLSDRLARALFALQPFDLTSPGHLYLAVLLIGCTTAIIAGFPVVAAVMVPLAEPLAAAAGVPVTGVLHATVAVFSMILLPHQEAPVAVGIQLARVPIGVALRYLLAAALLFLTLLSPLHFVWLKVIGAFTPGAP